MMKLGLLLLFVGGMGVSSSLVAMDHGATRLHFSVDDKSECTIFTKTIQKPKEEFPGTDAANIQTRLDSLRPGEVVTALNLLLADPAKKAGTTFFCAEMSDKLSHPLFIHVVLQEKLKKAYANPKGMTLKERKFVLYGLVIEIIEACLDACMTIDLCKISQPDMVIKYQAWKGPIDNYLGSIINDMTPMNYLSELISLVENRRTERRDNKITYFPAWICYFTGWKTESQARLGWGSYLPTTMDFVVGEDAFRTPWTSVNPDTMIDLRDSLYAAVQLVLREVKDNAGASGVDLTDDQNLKTWLDFLNKDLVHCVMEKYRTVQQVQRDQKRK